MATVGQPFKPLGGASLDCSTTTARVQIAGSGEQAVVTNPGTEAVYVEFGGAAIDATEASLAVLPATQILVTIPNSSSGVRSTHMAGITSTGTVTVQVSTGNGYWG